MPNVQQKALSARRQCYRNGGIVRVEVQVPAADAKLLRDLAAILRSKSGAAEAMRNRLRSVVVKPRVDTVFDIFGSDLPDAYFEDVFEQSRHGDTPRDVPF
jgi:hypothetical protein